MHRYKKHTHKTIANAQLAEEAMRSTKYDIDRYEACKMRAHEILTDACARIESCQYQGQPFWPIQLNAKKVHNIIDQTDEALARLRFQHLNSVSFLTRGIHELSNA